jgi:hypothetical protein
MSDDLIQAYHTTITDLEIAIESCGFFQFSARRRLEVTIKEFEDKINKLTVLKDANEKV